MYWSFLIKQECIPVRCVPSAAVAVSMVCLGVVCLGGVFLGCVCLGGVSAYGWSAQGVYNLTSVNRITHRCKNITFPQLRLQTVVKHYWTVSNIEIRF